MNEQIEDAFSVTYTFPNREAYDRFVKEQGIIAQIHLMRDAILQRFERLELWQRVNETGQNALYQQNKFIRRDQKKMTDQLNELAQDQKEEADVVQQVLNVATSSFQAVHDSLDALKDQIANGASKDELTAAIAAEKANISAAQAGLASFKQLAGVSDTPPAPPTPPTPPAGNGSGSTDTPPAVSGGTPSGEGTGITSASGDTSGSTSGAGDSAPPPAQG